MHKYIRTFAFTDEEWVKIKRISAIKGFRSLAAYIDHVVKDHIEKDYDEKYNEVFNE